MCVMWTYVPLSLIFTRNEGRKKCLFMVVWQKTQTNKQKENGGLPKGIFDRWAFTLLCYCLLISTYGSSMLSWAHTAIWDVSLGQWFTSFLFTCLWETRWCSGLTPLPIGSLKSVHVIEREQGVVALHLPIGPLKTHSWLKPKLRCEPSTYQPISQWFSYSTIKACPMSVWKQSLYLNFTSKLCPDVKWT